MYIAVFYIHIHAMNTHNDSVFFLKTPPKCVHLRTQRIAGTPIYFFTISDGPIKDITCKPCLVYISADVALQRGEMKHPDDIYTTLLLHNVILFRRAGEYTVQAANRISASNNFTSTLVTQPVQTSMKAKRPSSRIFTLL